MNNVLQKYLNQTGTERELVNSTQRSPREKKNNSIDRKLNVLKDMKAKYESSPSHLKGNIQGKSEKDLN